VGKCTAAELHGGTAQQIRLCTVTSIRTSYPTDCISKWIILDRNIAAAYSKSLTKAINSAKVSTFKVKTSGHTFTTPLQAVEYIRLLWL
jgi:hypothetical protein